MEQFELRFIAVRERLGRDQRCAKILFEAPLPGKVTACARMGNFFSAP